MKSAFTVLVLAVGLATQSAAADIFEPFTTANMNPFTRLHGVPQTRSAQLTTAGKLEVGLQLDVANNFTDSLSGNERVRLDGETHRTNLSLRYGLSERWELGIDLPYIRHSGGSLDGFIENWHSWFGLPNGGREDSAQDELNYFWRHGTQTRASLTRSESGMGDITVYAGYRLGGDDERQWTVRAGASLPTGDADSLTGSGGTDVFASLHVSQASLWRSERLRFHGSIGAALLDDTDIIGSYWRIIFNNDLQLSISSIAIRIDNGDKKVTVFSFTKQIVSESVTKANFAGIEINAGNRQCTENGDEFLPNRRNFLAIQNNGGKPIG